MLDDSALIARLRQILYGSDLEAGWSGFLDTMEGVTQERARWMAVEYAAPLVARWPDEIKTPPEAWTHHDGLNTDLYHMGDPLWTVVRHLPLPVLPPNLLMPLLRAHWLPPVTVLSLKGKKPNQPMPNFRRFLKVVMGLKLSRLTLERVQLGRNDLMGLDEMTHGEALTHLSILGCGLRARSIRGLINTRRLTGLTHLDLRHNRLGDAVVDQLLGWPQIEHLTHLDLRHNILHYPGARRLAGQLRRLDVLRLEHNQLKDTNAAALSHSRKPEERQQTLDKLLGAQKDVFGWQALCAFFDMWPQDERPEMERVLEQVEPQLESFDESLRHPMPRWVRALLASTQADRAHQPAAVWKMVRRLQLVGHGTSITGQPWAPQVGELLGAVASRLPVTHLEVDRLVMEQAQVEALVSAPWPDLKALTFTHVPCGDYIADALANASYLPRLERLDLLSSSLTDEAASRLFLLPRWGELRRLFLTGSALGESALEALAQGPLAGSLERLSLMGSSLPVAGVRKLYGGSFKKLQWLNLHNNMFGLPTLLEAVAARGLPALRTLAVGGYGRGRNKPSGVLDGEPEVTSTLETLLVDGDVFGPGDLETLLSKVHFERLEGLMVRSRFWGDALVERLVSDPALVRRMRRLALSGEDLTDAGLARLLSVNWESLESLEIRSQGVSAEHLPDILQGRHLPMLRRVLFFPGSPIPVSDLRQRLEKIEAAPHLKDAMFFYLGRGHTETQRLYELPNLAHLNARFPVPSWYA